MNLHGLMGAKFSPCRQWRYVLWRIWDADRPPIVWIGLNPSTADEYKDDPTCRREIDFSKRWGFGTYVKMNAYAYRATEPKDMKAFPEPIGPENDDYLLRCTEGVETIIACWGVHAVHLDRCTQMRQMFAGRLSCLKVTKGGHPQHPLYLPKTLQPRPYALLPSSPGQIEMFPENHS